MSRLFILLGSLCALVIHCYAPSAHMIVCKLEKYPTLPQNQTENKKVWSVDRKPTQGVYGSYFGYLASSSPSGDLIFPRKHQDTSFMLVVAKEIEPIFMLENTISTLQIPEKTEYGYYSIERKQDSKTQLYYWQVEKAQLPKDRNLPLNSIILFAHPNEIYVPVGVSVTSNSPQICLPTLYVKDTVRIADNALSVLNIRRFFEPVQQTFKTEKADVQSKIATTTT